jgi:lipopolysaccharide transport system permease protein
VTEAGVRGDVHDTSQPTIVIEARPDTVSARLRSLWRYRGFYGFLFNELTTRKGRGTLLGMWGVVLRVVLPAFGLIFAFGSVRPVDTGGVPYGIFFLSGYIPWRVFQSALRYVPRSLGWSQGLMKRTYFPRLLVPLAGFGMTFIEFAILSAVFAGMVGLTMWHGDPFPLRLGWHTLWLVPCLAFTLLFSLSFGLVFSVVALFFRDVIYSLTFFSQMMMFLTPVIYPVTFVPEHYRWVLYVLNPMAQIVIVSRYAMLGEGDVHLPFLLLSFFTILATLVASVAFFLRAELFLGDQM